MSVVQTDSRSIDAYLRDIKTEEAAVGAYLKLMDRERSCDIDNGVFALQQRIEMLSLENRQTLSDIRADLNKPIERFATQFYNTVLKIIEDDAVIRIPPWISSIPFEEHHRAMVRDRLHGSGNWLLQKPEFDEWMKSSMSSIIWLHGIPGSGKSKVVSTVVDYFLAQTRRRNGNSQDLEETLPQAVPMAYFYCLRDAADSQRADPEEILRSILKQLACSVTYTSIRDPVVTAYRQRKKLSSFHGSEPPSPSGLECLYLILELLEDNPAIIIIDALDECDPERRHDLLQALDTIIEYSTGLVKVFVSSRDDSDIVWKLANSPNIYISAKDNSRDIANFVHSELGNAIAQKRLLGGKVSAELQEQISSTLISRAQGI
jgi:hypothetical protein